MRTAARLSLIAAAVTGAAAIAAGFSNSIGSPVFFTETVSSNRSLPTSGCGTGGEGASLSGVTGLHAVVGCSDGSALDGGSFKGYFCDPGWGAWAKTSTAMDFSVAGTTLYGDGGAPALLGPEVQVTYPFGRMVYVSVGVGCVGASWDGGITSTLARAQQ